VRDAHSLYLETLAEVGIVGFALLAAMFLTVLATAVRRTLRAVSFDRGQLAAVTASLVVFFVAAAIDWVWELPVLPVIFMILAGLAVGAATRPAESATAGAATTGSRYLLATRIGIVALSIGALVAIAPPLAGSAALQDSQRDVRDSNLKGALDQARAAEKAQPYAATPKLQKALVLQQAGYLEDAANAAAAAVRDEPTNWTTWYTLSGIEGKLGNQGKAEAFYEKARSLNPRSPIFRTTPAQ
jgi:hypothetical protein